MTHTNSEEQQHWTAFPRCIVWKGYLLTQGIERCYSNNLKSYDHICVGNNELMKSSIIFYNRLLWVLIVILLLWMVDSKDTWHTVSSLDRTSLLHKYSLSICYQPGVLASSINRNWLEARQEIQGRLYWVPCCIRGSKNKQQVPFLLILRGGQACSLYWVRVAVCPRVKPEGWLKWLAHPLGSTVCRGHVQYPAFAPCSSKVAVGILGLCIFYSEFPLTVHASRYF